MPETLTDPTSDPTRGDLVPELTATLVINITDSYCGHCRKPVLPKSTHHRDVAGWTPKPGGGCTARFVDMRSDYRNVTDEDLRRVRPDLPVRPATPAGVRWTDADSEVR